MPAPELGSALVENRIQVFNTDHNRHMHALLEERNAIAVIQIIQNDRFRRCQLQTQTGHQEESFLFPVGWAQN